MSRSSITLALLLAAGASLTGCSDHWPSPPGPAAGREVTFNRESAEPTRRTVVVGTGIASVDVPSVQAAIDQGGDVVLEGHFSFDAPAAKPLAPSLASAASGLPPAAEVLIAKAVNISGASDEQSDMTTIDAGTIPFYVDAPGQRVAIRGLRFVRPTADAILVYAVHGLEIASTQIAGVVPFAHQSNGIGITASGNIPTPTSPGNPELISGTLRIDRNDIDMVGGTSGMDNTLGVTVFSAGVAGAEVDAHVTGNRIRNATEPAINFRRLVGHAAIEHNEIRTGILIGTAARNQVIRVANTGSYLVAHNSITCEWATSDAEGIGAFSQFAAWPVEDVVIVDNDIHMTPPAGTVFTTFSAGIGVYGFAQNTVVRNNTVLGSALAALAIPAAFPLPPQVPATPQDNAFVRNRFIDFTPSDADILVGDHAVRTRIVGGGTVDDRGTGTIIVRRGLGKGAERSDHARSDAEPRRSVSGMDHHR